MMGTDYCNGAVYGNTILGAMYMPFNTLEDEKIGPKIRDLSIVTGKLAAYFLDTNLEPFSYDDRNNVSNIEIIHF